jgi:chorismate synthase
VKYHQSLGYADLRGSGRASYRATISDVIGGSIARIFLASQFGTAFLSSVTQVGDLRARHTLAHELETLVGAGSLANPVPRQALQAIEERLGQAAIPSLDTEFAGEAGALIERTRAAGDSIGALVEVIAVNVPALVGAPLYQSLKLRLMGSLGGLNAAQSCEIGAGLDVVQLRGSENNDPIRRTGFVSNHHGGLLGGITTGMPLVCRVGFKPTASIQVPQRSVRQDLHEIDFELRRGRHDPCAGIRAGVTLESRMAIELANAVLMRQAGLVDPDSFVLPWQGVSS